jgi:hypothetical protein
MTGTLSRNSIMGYWHMLCWAFPDGGAPVPYKEGEAKMWASAIDNKHRERRPAPGPLGASLQDARQWYRDRLHQTPGVVIVDGDSCDAPISVRLRLAREDAVLDHHYRLFGKEAREEKDVPDGLIVSDPLSRWRIDGQLGTGYFLRYVPPGPPAAWRLARRVFAGFVRGVIEESQRTNDPCDTEAQVVRRFVRDGGELPEPIADWLAAKAEHGDSFPTEPVWLTESAILSARDWLAESREPSIVWCGGIEFAEALATVTRLPYYGREGKEWHTGRGLHAADVGSSLIASWHANKRGFNLQPWRRMLLVHPPQSAKYLEQIFGRAHRSGQDREVVIDILATSGGTLDAFESALAEASFARSTVGMTQKILRADITRARPMITASNRFRWARREK